MNVNLDLIQLKHSFNTHIAKNTIIRCIIDKLLAIPNIQELKGDLEIILYVCNILENNITKNLKPKLDKKQIAIDIMTAVFSLNTDEQRNIAQHIEFLHSNGKIKCVPLFKKIESYFLKCVFLTS